MDKLIQAPSFETFQDNVDRSLSVAGDDSELELASIDTSHDVVDDWERFTLVFRSDDPLEPGMHRLSGDSLDPFDVTLSPVPSMVPGSSTIEYEAVFNRYAPGRVAPGTADRGTSPGGLLTDGGMGLSAEPLLGSVGLFAGNFAPVGYMLCAGQLIQITQNEALFSILGDTYGGDARTTFELPDLRGRSPIGAGEGPGLTRRPLGERGGSETVSLTADQLAPHTHGSEMNLPVSSEEGNKATPAGNALATLPRGADLIYTDEDTDGSMPVDGEIAPEGDGHPHPNMAPYLALNYVICTNGLYPQRQ